MSKKRKPPGWVEYIHVMHCRYDLFSHGERVKFWETLLEIAEMADECVRIHAALNAKGGE